MRDGPSPPRFHIGSDFVTTLVLGVIVFGVLGALVSTGVIPAPFAGH